MTDPATTHGSAFRAVPAHRAVPIHRAVRVRRGSLMPASWRNNRTRTNTSPPMIGSMTSVTAAPAPYCS